MKIIERKVNSHSKRTLIMTVTRLELELLHAITKTAYLHTPKMPITTRLVSD